MSTPSSKHSAPGPYLGFGLQTVRLCAHLLTQPKDSHVSVEHDDDVSVRFADGSRLLEQTKSALKQNPVADWARDLWKTLHNWLEDNPPTASSAPPTNYCLYVTPTHGGDYVSALSDAKTDADVSTLVARVKNDAAANGRKKSAVYTFAKRFLDAPVAEQVGLAIRFRLVCEEDPLESIRKHYRPSVREELLDEVCAYAIGHAKNQTDALLRLGKKGEIASGQFQETVRLFVQRINLPALFVTAPAPSPSDVSSTFSGRPVFVRQLELVGTDRDQQMNAVSDFLRASACKTTWGAQGVLLPGSLDAWDETLVRRHKAIADGLSNLHSHLVPEKLGAAIYAECRKLQLSLDARSVPDHFTHGCLNDLADREQIGWHPEYATLLRKA